LCLAFTAFDYFGRKKWTKASLSISLTISTASTTSSAKLQVLKEVYVQV
jgi:hypothetical protein